jgi:hypothetical protein
VQEAKKQGGPAAAAHQNNTLAELRSRESAAAEEERRDRVQPSGKQEGRGGKPDSSCQCAMERGVAGQRTYLAAAAHTTTPKSGDQDSSHNLHLRVHRQ